MTFRKLAQSALAVLGIFAAICLLTPGLMAPWVQRRLTELTESPDNVGTGVRLVHYQRGWFRSLAVVQTAKGRRYPVVVVHGPIIWRSGFSLAVAELYSTTPWSHNLLNVAVVVPWQGGVIFKLQTQRPIKHHHFALKQLQAKIIVPDLHQANIRGHITLLRPHVDLRLQNGYVQTTKLGLDFHTEPCRQCRTPASNTLVVDAKGSGLVAQVGDTHLDAQPLTVVMEHFDWSGLRFPQIERQLLSQLQSSPQHIKTRPKSSIAQQFNRDTRVRFSGLRVLPASGSRQQWVSKGALVATFSALPEQHDVFDILYYMDLNFSFGMNNFRSRAVHLDDVNWRIVKHHNESLHWMIEAGASQWSDLANPSARYGLPSKLTSGFDHAKFDAELINRGDQSDLSADYSTKNLCYQQTMPKRQECVERLSVKLASKHLLGINPSKYRKLRHVLTQYGLVSRIRAQSDQQRSRREHLLASFSTEMNHLFFAKNSSFLLQAKGSMKPGQSLIKRFKGDLTLRPYTDSTGSTKKQQSSLTGKLVIEVNQTLPADYWLERMRQSGSAVRQKNRYIINI